MNSCFTQNPAYILPLIKIKIMVEVITSKIFTKFPHIKHGYFSSKGGISVKNYKSLNFGYNTNDLVRNIDRNYQIAAQNLNISRDNIITLKQTHSNIIHEFKENSRFMTNILEGDGIFTSADNIAISVLTADCLPILIFISDLNIIAAIHAGWRGAINGIIDNFFINIFQKGAKKENVYVALMPSITQKSYEVGINFYNYFIKQNPNNIKFFQKSSKYKFLFNLRLYVLEILYSYNLSNIDDIAIDTYSNNHICFSHRRSIHNKTMDTGRNLSFIMKNM